MRLSPLFLVLLLGCPDEPADDPPPDPDAEPPPVLEPCAREGVLYTRDRSQGGRLVSLEETASLGVVLGFQGFIFSELFVDSPVPLPGRVDAQLFSQVPGLVDQSAWEYGVPTDDDGDRWRTDELLVFYNDVPQAELIGHPATVTIKLDAVDCVLTSRAEVELVSGGFEGPDDGVDGAVDALDAGVGDAGQ